MTTLDFARQHVRFDKSSPITGPFREDFYPFLKRPFAAADDIRVKRLVILKASSCMGTVAGQIINLKRIVCDVGDQKMVCQTDDDGDLWAKTRGKEWIRSNPDASRLLSRDKYSMTNNLWIFRHKFLEISGPSIAAAQSVQVRYVQTDESHLDNFPPGRLIEFEKRMGARWDRQATHITTAPDVGREVDGFYNEGQQDEWHFRCPKCSELFWPLWGKDAVDKYDAMVFWPSGDTSQSMNAWPSPSMDGGTALKCPHCEAWHHDTARERYALVKDGDYVAQNPCAPIETRSFRWSVFAAHWISWREIFAEHKSAMESAKLGDLKPLEDFTKKRLCKSWLPILPDFGEGRGANDYRVGDVWNVVESEKFMGIDRQAGKASEGEHLWCLIVQYDRRGNSRRLCFRRVETFSQADALAQEHGVKPSNVYCDSGFENRSTFRECGKRKWMTTRGTDETEFFHTRRTKDTVVTYPLPYSEAILQSGIVGQKQPDKAMRFKRGTVPNGWAIQIAMANPTLYGYLSALIGGLSGRYFGIASDFPIEYKANMPAFIAVTEPDKKTNTVKRVMWRKVREDHAWDTEAMCLLAAIRSGYFPLAKPIPNE